MVAAWREPCQRRRAPNAAGPSIHLVPRHIRRIPGLTNICFIEECAHWRVEIGLLCF